MFKYDDYDYESLLNDPAVDPDSADALYALAQFCRTGKGCPASEVAYQNICSAPPTRATHRLRQSWTPQPCRSRCWTRWISRPSALVS